MDFQCLACTMIETKFATFTEICSHMQQEHGVEDLLGSPATKAVLLPTYLDVHTCLLCTRKDHYLGKQQILDHLGESHSIFFQKEWETYSNTQCRICDKLVSGDDFEFHVAKEHPKKNFAETEIIFNIKDESDDGDETANRFVKMDPVIPSLGQNHYSSIPNRRWITSNAKAQDEVEDQIKTIALQLTMGEISGLVENNRELLECIQRSNKVIITIKGTTVIISGKPESLENAKLRLMNFQKEIFSVEVSKNEAKIVIGRNNKNLRMIEEVSGARLHVKDGEEVIVRGKEAAVIKAKSMLERILDRNISGRDPVQYRKELEAGDKFSFVLSSKEIRSILGVKGTNIEAIRDAADAIIHCKKYNGEEKLILEGSEDAKNKAKTLIERVLSKEVTMKLSYKQTVNIFPFLKRLTTSTGAIINQVFKGSKDDFCGGLSIIGSEMQVEQAVEMVRDMLGEM